MRPVETKYQNEKRTPLPSLAEQIQWRRIHHGYINLLVELFKAKQR